MVCDFTNRVLDKFGCDLTREVLTNGFMISPLGGMTHINYVSRLGIQLFLDPSMLTFRNIYSIHV
ncbi:hypothetical protein HYPBUDRAFT_153750 [Hyphopichia burtonii NRRL Y-1933]|uniref:Uncharacterized protein n=1 Tax=Hyphopichia burtonii NRRL Y-1933 TaxID=984485 RepID=A0A1E4RDV5_9ASCO|nr:hypothetical protein HYPBUDRAFT_153750 [Hyphopichia burtonii NRRL Y-1933]ODV65437.1 hypothetical protein HYPBUDRAFT_153750 [Hyphopichia burtonii NRRL Y-1933]